MSEDGYGITRQAEAGGQVAPMGERFTDRELQHIALYAAPGASAAAVEELERRMENEMTDDAAPIERVEARIRATFGAFVSPARTRELAQSIVADMQNPPGDDVWRAALSPLPEPPK